MNIYETLIARMCHDFASPLSALIMSVEAFSESRDDVFLEHINSSAKKILTNIDLYRLISAQENIQLSHWSKVMQEYMRLDNIVLKLHSSASTLPPLHNKVLSYSVLYAKRFIPKGGVISITQDREETVCEISSTKMLLPGIEIQKSQLQDIDSKNVFECMLLKLLEEIHSSIDFKSGLDKHLIRFIA